MLVIRRRAGAKIQPFEHEKTVPERFAPAGHTRYAQRATLQGLQAFGLGGEHVGATRVVDFDKPAPVAVARPEGAVDATAADLMRHVQIHAPAHGLAELAADVCEKRAHRGPAQTPMSRVLESERRSTRMAMKARSNLWRQMSEARSRSSLRMVMTRESLRVRTSALRTLPLALEI